MRWYFSDPNTQALLMKALLECEGTPFREGIEQPGQGFDCAHFVAYCYRKAGVDVAALENMPPVSLNYGRFHKDSKLLTALLEDPQARKRLHRLDEDEPLMCGDLLGIREHRGVNHLAIAENSDWAWHVPRGGSVCRVYLPHLRGEFPCRYLRRQPVNHIATAYRLKQP